MSKSTTKLITQSNSDSKVQVKIGSSMKLTQVISLILVFGNLGLVMLLSVMNNGLFLKELTIASFIIALLLMNKSLKE